MAAGVVEATALVPDVVRSVTSAARELLDMGATRLVIPGNFPLGCVPSYMAAVDDKDPAAYDATGCLAALNLFAQMHNVLLQQGIRELRRAYPGATIAYADYFYAYVRMLRDAGEAGFDAAALTRACCGAGAGAYNFDMDRMCGAPGASVCARPEERVSWDGVHLTQRAYRVMTDLLYHKGFASPAPVEFPRA
ncbi:GDSL esterase/lipase At5g03980-like [Panicum virgatum]|nr:GDSL esterase/lipase At5g03980-like [Panicum virgatum]